MREEIREFLENCPNLLNENNSIKDSIIGKSYEHLCYNLDGNQRIEDLLNDGNQLPCNLIPIIMLLSGIEKVTLYIVNDDSAELHDKENMKEEKYELPSWIFDQVTKKKEVWGNSNAKEHTIFYQPGHYSRVKVINQEAYQEVTQLQVNKQSKNPEHEGVGDQKAEGEDNTNKDDLTSVQPNTSDTLAIVDEESGLDAATGKDGFVLNDNNGKNVKEMFKKTNPNVSPCERKVEITPEGSCDLDGSRQSSGEAATHIEEWGKILNQIEADSEVDMVEQIKGILKDRDLSAWEKDNFSIAHRFQVLRTRELFNLPHNYVTTRSLIDIAAFHGCLGIVKYLVDAKVVNVNEGSCDNALRAAVKNGHENLVKFLLDEGVDVDLFIRGNRTLLTLAAENGRLGVVKVLLDKGANVDLADAEWRTPLHCAVINDNLEVVEALLNKGANANTEGKSIPAPLHLAVESDNLGIVKALLDKGANVNQLNNRDGKSPLHCAVENGNSGMVIALLDKGANVDVKDMHEKSPLCYAIENEHKGIAELLGAHKVKLEGSKVESVVPAVIDAKEDIRPALISNNENSIPLAKGKGANESISPEETNVPSIPEKLQPENSALAPDNTEGLFSKNAASANSSEESRAGAINAKTPVSDQVNNTQDNDVPPSNPNGITPQNEKRSNLPVMVSASMAITGVATGIAIAVYLEMLAVGIAVGACCLVAAAIIYYCNRPSNSLKNSSAEALGNKVQKVVNPT